GKYGKPNKISEWELCELTDEELRAYLDYRNSVLSITDLTTHENDLYILNEYIELDKHKMSQMCCRFQRTFE
ncbi:hypothetical protein LCGC14_0377660, partial [marine sediment metagenome]